MTANKPAIEPIFDDLSFLCDDPAELALAEADFIQAQGDEGVEINAYDLEQLINATEQGICPNTGAFFTVCKCAECSKARASNPPELRPIDDAGNF